MRVWAPPSARAVPWQCVGLSAYLCVTFRRVCVCVCVWWQRHCRAPIEPALSTCIKLPALTLHHPELWQPPNWKHRPDQGRYIINTHTLYTHTVYPSICLQSTHAHKFIIEQMYLPWIYTKSVLSTQFSTLFFSMYIHILVIFLNCLSLTYARSLYTHTNTKINTFGREGVHINI